MTVWPHRESGMEFDLEQAMELLTRTPGVLRELLGGVSEPWAHNNYGAETFSPFDVVGHLIHAERTNWMVRARVILDDGEARPLPPFDRYAMFDTSMGKTIRELLDTFKDLRRQSLSELRALNLTAMQLAQRGTHPAVGTVTLQQLLATWVVHDLNHVHQIAKAMAYQYRAHVGPWVEFLTILPQPSQAAATT